MNRVRAQSAPSLVPSSTDESGERGDSSLEDVTATLKLLMKQVQDYRTISRKYQNDSKIMIMVDNMMTILENTKKYIKNSQPFENAKKESETRFWQTEIKNNNELVDEMEKLMRELKASCTAQKSLEAICSSMGKEKEIMASELVRKSRDISGMEELLSDLKAQNETLSSKMKQLIADNKGKSQCHVALQERNKHLSEKLLRALEGYKSMKRKLKEADDENRAMRETMEEMDSDIGTSLERIQGFKQRVGIGVGGESTVEIEEKIAELENMFAHFQTKVSKHGKRMGDCVKSKDEISVCSPVLA